MIRKLAEINKDLLAFCGNPDCHLYHLNDQAANLAGKISYREESRNQVRIVTRKLYVGISGKGAVWFCSDCADEIEKNKTPKKSLPFQERIPVARPVLSLKR